MHPPSFELSTQTLADVCLSVWCTGAFDDDDVTHVEGEVNPVRDLEIIHDELRLKDDQYVAKQLVSSVDDQQCSS